MLWYPSCAGWHGTSYSDWLAEADFGFHCGAYGMFSFRGEDYWMWGSYCSRGVAVIGTGL